MDKQKAFNIIKSVFRKSLASFDDDRIQNERDWEMHLYGLFKDEIGAERIKDYHLFIEFRAAKYDGKNKLWITPNKYNKKKELINKFYDVKVDPTGHILIELDKNKLPLDKNIIRVLNDEKERAYYIDIILLKRSDFSRIFLIELKYGSNIQEKVKEDYYKLKRTESVKNHDAIYISIGYDTNTKEIYWMPTKKKYDYSLDINKLDKIKKEKNKRETELTPKIIEQILKDTTKEIYEDYIYITEATWASEIMFQITKKTTDSWRCNSEIKGIFDNPRERLDLGVYNNKNEKLIYGIELKGHWEGGTPYEIRLDMANDKKIEKDFLLKTKEFLKKYNQDKSLKSKLSAYPKYKGIYFLNPDFFDKIIEMYHQCERLNNNKYIENAFMVFIDHQDDFSIRKKTPSFSYEVFIQNFSYRKKLIMDILKPVSGKCEIIYFYALNIRNNKKKMFLLDDQ